jgi:murein DD-endopeptidase MepM/ murein hydrolase activator NlpD
VWGSLNAEPLKTDAAAFIAAGDPSVIAPLPDAEPLVAAVTAPPAVNEPSPMAEPLATAPTRRSRRAGQTGEQPIVPKVVAAAEPVEAVVQAPAPAPALDTVLVAAEPFELLEPELPDAADANVEGTLDADDAAPLFDADRASAPTAAEIDAFEAAARLFSFTGETPIQFAAARDDAPAADSASREHVVPRRNRGASFKRVSAASFSFGVMGVVGLLTVGMTTPVAAVASPGGTDITSSLVASSEDEAAVSEDEIQAYVTPTEVESAAIERAENYATVTMAQIASESGISNFSNFFVNDPNSAIQWPFAVGVPITYGYGMRSGRMHEGVDFTPGAGSPIQAIADGVVRVSTDSGGAYGVHVIIDHVIDGQLVSSHYAHMQYGSRQVQVGDKVTVATVLGRTGNTGRSYGAHTHFELLMNGTTAIDPIPWLRQHAGG